MPETDTASAAVVMDAAADVARNEFMSDIVLGQGSAKDVALWLKKHYKTAGYKRLSKILIEYADRTAT